MAEHRSDSASQRKAEGLILSALSERLGTELEQTVRMSVGNAAVEVDGASADRRVLVEVFARVGRLKGAQLHKVSTDALKLVALGMEHPDARCIIAFASEEALASVVGWRAEVLASQGIETMVCPLDNAARADVVAAQERQQMVNAPALEDEPD